MSNMLRSSLSRVFAGAGVILVASSLWGVHTVAAEPAGSQPAPTITSSDVQDKNERIPLETLLRIHRPDQGVRGEIPVGGASVGFRTNGSVPG